jgi:glutathione S-transferase
MIARYALLEAGIIFDNRRMDIHLAKEQLSDWYRLINPKMTVPSLVDDQHVWIDSSDILKCASTKADAAWMDGDKSCHEQIKQIVGAHYAIAIERLTFSKILSSFPLMRYVFLKMLRTAVNELQSQLVTTSQTALLEAKIKQNEARLSYFTTGSLDKKLDLERDSVRQFLEQLPTPSHFLFGAKPSAADIVTVVLLARLKMIGEYDLVSSSELIAWFERMNKRKPYKQADIWTRFKPWRIVFKY